MGSHVAELVVGNRGRNVVNHAANSAAEPYDRVRANTAYTARACGYYREHHVRRAGHMFAQAAGLSPDGWFAKLVTKMMWAIVERRGRAFRVQAA